MSPARAQSGRRIPKKTEPKAKADPEPETPAAAPAAKAEPAKEKSKEPGLSFLVVKQDPGPGAGIPTMGNTGFLHLVMESCLRRLADSSAQAKPGGDMNRKQAYDRAKSEEAAYVVWLELKVDSAGSSDPDLAGTGPRDYGRLFVSYTVYTPGTGKVKTQGSVYQRRNTVPVGGGPPTRSPRVYTQIEYRLQEMGYEIGDRIIDKFGMNPPIRR